MSSRSFSPLIQFLQSDLGLSGDAIAVAFRTPLLSPNQVPVALWQLGLLSLEEVSRVFDWLEHQPMPDPA
ncbi:DUF2949 domain-containing protein [Lyngbya confervoides]|uniref:DUF2949 domain-containing protein n=1 Tax=Lyngbya confervoides BDU141951 TaxID=1574623 RepID=A0ABD4TA36_9CYAN|nr:DUF2949 domain-containing protein [Lyngbya confervoides]MCM1985406.1 DUF2949 domain-containing protein [Lyngbya confervoides BDU141951]